MRRLGSSLGLPLDRRRLLGLACTAGAGAGAVAVLGPPAGLGSYILSLIEPAGGEPYRRTIACMGTFVSIDIHDRNGEGFAGAVEQAFEEVRAVDALMSVFRPDSQISRLNREAGRGSMAVDPRVAEVLRAARLLGAQSSGVFDVTVLPLMRAFGFREDHREDSRGEEPRRPTPEVLHAALEQVDYRAIEVDSATAAAGLEHPGTAIDLGGIAKGYAVDRAAEVLRARGVRQAVINAGGDLRVLGAPGSPGPGRGDGWCVGITDPLQPGRILATLELRDQAIATSGNYEQFIEVGEERFGHLIDPRSGTPTEPMLSATVVAPTAMHADAASTTAFLMGNKPGARYVEETYETDYVFLSSVQPSGTHLSDSQLSGSHLNSFRPSSSQRSEDGIEIQASPGINGLAMSQET
jgi:thiamine biosynthesis lipoprotein